MRPDQRPAECTLIPIVDESCWHELGKVKTAPELRGDY